MDEPKNTQLEESKHETAANKRKAGKKFKLKWKFLSIVLLAALVVSILTGGFGLKSGGTSPGSISAEKAASIAVSFVNENFLSEGQTAALVGVEEEKGLYKVFLDVDGQNFTSYITKDAKLFFPSGAEIKEVATATPTQQQSYPKTDKPDVKLFVMSYCPYGNQAEDAMKPVIELLGEKVNFEPHYIFYSGYASLLRSRGYDVKNEEYCLDQNETYCSMHGIQELNEDVRELCVYRDQKDKFWGFVDAMNSNCSALNADSCWEGVAKNVGVDVAAVKKCQDSERLALVKSEMATSAYYNAGGSPTLIINNKEYSGGRTAEAYKQAVCSAFNTPPEECSEQLSAAGGAASGQC